MIKGVTSTSYDHLASYSLPGSLAKVSLKLLCLRSLLEMLYKTMWHAAVTSWERGTEEGRRGFVAILCDIVTNRSHCHMAHTSKSLMSPINHPSLDLGDI